MTKKHYSDCAVHNEPAYPKGDCDCGGYEDITELEALRAENARLLDLIGRLANTIEFLNSTHNAGEGEDIVAEARKAMGESDE